MTTIAPEQRTAVGHHRRELEVILASAPAGAAAIVACAARPATCGPPLHVHAASDETFLVLSGVLLVYADGQVATIPEGGLVHVSGGMPHTFATTPDSPARFFVLHTPAGPGEFHIAAAYAVQKHVGPLPRDEHHPCGPDLDWQLVDPPPPTGAIPANPVMTCPSDRGRCQNLATTPGRVSSCQQARGGTRWPDHGPPLG
jgi:mannose-6-phosphate isomerase-like protein (cupin superfamily)